MSSVAIPEATPSPERGDFTSEEPLTRLIFLVLDVVRYLIHLISTIAICELTTYFVAFPIISAGYPIWIGGLLTILITIYLASYILFNTNHIFDNLIQKLAESFLPPLADVSG